MTPPTKLDKFTDLPPRIAELLRSHDRQMKLVYGLLGVLATGLVGVTTFCLNHHG